MTMFWWNVHPEKFDQNFNVTSLWQFLAILAIKYPPTKKKFLYIGMWFKFVEEKTHTESIIYEILNYCLKKKTIFYYEFVIKMSKIMF